MIFSFVKSGRGGSWELTATPLLRDRPLVIDRRANSLVF
jgi:hypothetical protein